MHIFFHLTQVYNHFHFGFTTSLDSVSGPKPETVADFWWMIWEQKTTTIVMLTNLKERKEVFSLCTALF